MTRAEIIRETVTTLPANMRLTVPTGTKVAAVVMTVPQGGSRDSITATARRNATDLFRKTFGPIDFETTDVVEQVTHTLGELAYEIRALA